MQTIGLKQLKDKYHKGDNFFRTILCRPEFNQFRESLDNFFVFNDELNFHKMLSFIIKNKEKRYNRTLILFIFLLFGCQTAWCYPTTIIYNQYGEPQTVLKGNIRYDNYGVPKSNIKTEGSMYSVCPQQGNKTYRIYSQNSSNSTYNRQNAFK